MRKKENPTLKIKITIGRSHRVRMVYIVVPISLQIKIVSYDISKKLYISYFISIRLSVQKLLIRVIKKEKILAKLNLLFVIHV